MKKIIFIIAILFSSCEKESKKEECNIENINTTEENLYKVEAYKNNIFQDSLNYYYDDRNKIYLVQKNGKDFIRYKKLNDTLHDVYIYEFENGTKKINVNQVITKNNRILQINEFNKNTNAIKKNRLSAKYINDILLEIKMESDLHSIEGTNSNITYSDFLFQDSNLVGATATYWIFPYFGFPVLKIEKYTNNFSNFLNSRKTAQNFYNTNGYLQLTINAMALQNYYLTTCDKNLISRMGFINNTLDSLDYYSQEYTFTNNLLESSRLIYFEADPNIYNSLFFYK
jgi:hypothetical protein